MAEYADENQLLEAARKVRDSGYTRTDAFTPFPVHGIDEALGIAPTVLPWIVLSAGLTGLGTALLMQWWMNAVDYPYIISSKPYFSLPANIPVTFELTVLFSAFTAFFAMLGLNGLPRFSNPLFANPKFDRSTDDRFFLWVDSRDKYFNSAKVKSLLESTQPLGIDEVREDDSPTEIPRAFYYVAFTVILVSLVPASIVLRMRSSRAEGARWHVFFDMDFQPKKKTQQGTTLFADGRVMRPPVAGTIAQGDLELSDPFYLGYDPDKSVSLEKSTDVRLVSFSQDESKAASPDAGQPPAPAARIETASKTEAPVKSEAPVSTGTPAAVEAKSTSVAPAGENSSAEKKLEEPAAHLAPTPAPSPSAQPHGDTGHALPAGQTATAPAAGEVNLPWITQFPLTIDSKLLELGKKKFDINCAVCHGYAGNGDGLVSQRAFQLAQGYWVQPTSLHDDKVATQPIGKIFYTITNGKGKMGSYGSVLTPEERWAIVSYVRSLQESRNATIEDVPEAMRAELAGSAK